MKSSYASKIKRSTILITGGTGSFGNTVVAQLLAAKPKRVIILVTRYILAAIFIIIYISTKSYLILYSIFLILIFYTLWSTIKNYKYVKSPLALIYLPIIQFTSDFAVILGTARGLIT